jgi:hypothetical protein
MPPQQAKGLLDFIDRRLCFGAHLLCQRVVGAV